MKPAYKKLLSAAILISSIIPGITFADTGSFCANVDAKTIVITKEIIIRESALRTKQLSIRTTLVNQRISRDNLIKARRDDHDNTLQGDFKKLQASAKNEAQKSAIGRYINQIIEARATRRTAVGAAMQAFRQGLDEALAKRQQAVNTAISAFKTSVQTAISTAKADCAAGKDSEVVRTNLRTSLKLAREKFAADRAAVEKLNVSVTTLVTARKSALEEALKNFQTAIEKAHTDFKTAMK